MAYNDIAIHDSILRWSFKCLIQHMNIDDDDGSDSSK